MFLTPNAPTGNETRYVLLRIPASPGFSGWLVGALAELTKELNWKPDGNLKPYQVASMYARMVQDMIFYQPPQIGTFIDSLVDLPTSHFLLCDGSTYQAADWPELFALLPESLKTVSDFTLPNMAGVNRVGSGTRLTTAYDFLDEGGEETHTLSEAEMPIHTHAVSTFLEIAVPAPGEVVASLELPFNLGQTQPAGGSQTHNNMPPHIPIKVYICGKLP